ncbi:MAG: type IV pilus inner membrane component PilO [Planctomycetota bacterium]|jgi:type IV pilus assembly protein PilO
MINNLKRIAFSILLLVLTYVAYGYMIKPINDDLNEKTAKAEAKLEKIVKLIKLDGSEKATFAAQYLSKQIIELQQAIGFFESKLPPTSEIHKVLEQVTVIAQKEGLKPKTIRTLKPMSNSGYVEQPLKMELVGDFNSFYSFLLELEKLDRIMKFRELKLDKQSKVEGQMSANLVVSIFFQHS